MNGYCLNQKPHLISRQIKKRLIVKAKRDIVTVREAVSKAELQKLRKDYGLKEMDLKFTIAFRSKSATNPPLMLRQLLWN
jgi:hypothetical protein